MRRWAGDPCRFYLYARGEGWGTCVPMQPCEQECSDLPPAMAKTAFPPAHSPVCSQVLPIQPHHVCLPDSDKRRRHPRAGAVCSQGPWLAGMHACTKRLLLLMVHLMQSSVAVRGVGGFNLEGWGSRIRSRRSACSAGCQRLPPAAGAGAAACGGASDSSLLAGSSRPAPQGACRSGQATRNSRLWWVCQC